MNLLVFSGTVVREPRYSDGGKSPVLGFTLVSNRKWRDKEFTTYCDVSVFGERATELRNQFKVSDYVQVQGEAGARAYDSKGGEHKASLTCNALSVEVVAQTSSERIARKTEVASSPVPSTDGGDSDIPF